MKVDVSECIIDLLHNGSKVSLPGIGSLYVQNSSAEIKNDQIFPPHRNIVFTEEESDGLDLANIIKRRYKVTQATATNVVKKFSQILINKLVNFNSVRIPNIGSFSNSDKGAFTFTEERNSINVGKEILPIYTLQKVAVSSFTDKASTVKPAALGATAAAAAATTTIIKTEESVPVAGIKSTVDATRPNSVRTITTVQTNPKPVYKSPPVEEESFLRRFLWPILLLLLLGLLLTLGFKKCTSWLNNQLGTADDIENGNSDSIEGQGNGQGTDDSLTNGGNSDATDAANLIEYDLSDLDNIPESVFADGCTIIVGSFGKSRNALNMISRLKRMGYDTYKAVNDQGMTRVGIEIDCSPDNFESILRKIRSEVEPTSWSLIPRIKVQY